MNQSDSGWFKSFSFLFLMVKWCRQRFWRIRISLPLYYFLWVFFQSVSNVWRLIPGWILELMLCYVCFFFWITDLGMYFWGTDSEILSPFEYNNLHWSFYWLRSSERIQISNQTFIYYIIFGMILLYLLNFQFKAQWTLEAMV